MKDIKDFNRNPKIVRISDLDEMKTSGSTYALMSVDKPNDRSINLKVDSDPTLVERGLLMLDEPGAYVGSWLEIDIDEHGKVELTFMATSEQYDDIHAESRRVTLASEFAMTKAACRYRHNLPEGHEPIFYTHISKIRPIDLTITN